MEIAEIIALCVFAILGASFGTMVAFRQSISYRHHREIYEEELQKLSKRRAQLEEEERQLQKKRESSLWYRTD